MRIVYTSGTFDLFHIGHLNVIRKSKALGDYLIVGVSTDDLVVSYKRSAPVISFEDRAEIVRNLSFVNQVVMQESLFDINMMRKHGVNVMSIGSDWENKKNDGLLEVMNDESIEVIFLPYTESVSSSHIKDSICDNWQEDK